MRKELIIFDFDGTLVDSMSLYAEKASDLISSYYDLDKATAKSLYLKTSGRPFIEQLNILFPGDKKNTKVANMLETWKASILHQLKPFPDVMPLFAELKNRGFLIAVSSNNLQNYVEKIVNSWEIKPNFVLGWDGKDFKKGEPHISYLEKVTSVNRDKFLMVGDSPHDLRIALTCKLDFVALLRGFPEESFKSILPSVKVIRSLSTKEFLLLLEDRSNPLKDSYPVLPL